MIDIINGDEFYSQWKKLWSHSKKLNHAGQLIKYIQSVPPGNSFNEQITTALQFTYHLWGLLKMLLEDTQYKLYVCVWQNLRGDDSQGNSCLPQSVLVALCSTVITAKHRIVLLQPVASDRQNCVFLSDISYA